jgi:hypothetical protein
MIRSFATMTTAGFLLLNGSGTVRAQAPHPRIEQQVDIMILQGNGQTAVAAPPFAAGGPGMDFISMPFGLGVETVTGAPYSAEAVTLVVQTLADGNRISRESKAAVYRDAAGRIRREQGLAIIGRLVGGPENAEHVQIVDPQAGVTYMLDMANRTAHKLAVPKIARRGSTAPLRVPDAGTFELPLPTPAAGAHGAMFYRSGVFSGSTAPEIEQLGKQTIEGIVAEGTRSTFTIAAGQIGNDLPLHIVSERWFSPELNVLVVSRHSDPRFGETTYRLTNIVRVEPPPALFEPPPDFTIVEPGAAPRTRMRMRKQ